ncbi:MAG TPA: HAD family hydrolase [Synergistaceae bacterium]|jgi:3-deoxy-D-manno-octulosonate 8-phosphate phosphatase (KDO 8-P phosphatase)|nr:MAG: 3-deoxy-D-manno-octulosonate 8-phosphate phosphatase, YrbI family [Synergistales bacterium 57_84]MDI9392641.1 HAD-IIIA family hydrolase [Synergistota bacterium]HBG13931.1 HAD family hydrolase [Synergistaceae bacterium]HCP07051.1 HAD family hydrolase [Synergistaceae bacterium]HCR38915.1 HAD family hydrolase [Synergistaceae bacterium]
MIRLFVMDVDGTMTDGAVFLDGEGREFKRFDVKDGLGVAMLTASGVRTAIISGRYSAVTDRRAKELGIDMVVQGVKDKLSELKRLAAEIGLGPEEIAYIGDDVNDRECIFWAGRGFAPSDARHEAKEAADVVTEARGGFGAIRDAAEDILNFNEIRETK